MKRGMITLSLGLMVISALLIAGCALPTAAPTPVTETAADFYKKNTVTVIVGTAAGGGTDYGTRVFSTFWNQYTGGTMAVENRGAGGGIGASNYVYKERPADGLTIGVHDSGNLVNAVLGKLAGVEFDLTRMQYIGRFSPQSPHVIVASPRSPYKSVADLQKAKGLKIGVGGLSSGFAPGLMMTINALDLKDAKFVVGYKGSSDTKLALTRGEIDVTATDLGDYDLDREKGIVGPALVVLTWERVTEPKSLKDVPALPEVASLTAEQRGFLDRQTKYRAGGKVLWLRPEVAADKVKFLRESFDKIAADENFIKMLKIREAYLGPSMSGEQTTAYIRGILTQDPAPWERLMALGKEYAAR